MEGVCLEWTGEDMTADYVIIGSGSAGSAIAYRLGEAGKKVVVIEQGGTDMGPFIQMPAALSYPCLLYTSRCV